MSIKPFSRVRLSVCALSLLLLVLSWGYFAISFKRDYQVIEAHAGQHVRVVALGLEEYTQRLFQTHDMVLLDIRNHLLAAEPLEQLQGMLDNWQNRLPLLGALRIIDAETAEILFEVTDGPAFWPDDINYQAVDAFEGSFSPLQIAEKPYRDQNGDNQIAIWRRLRIDKRRFFVVALLRTRGLSDFNRSLELYNQSAVAILYESGVVLARVPTAKTFAGGLYAADTTFVSALKQGQGGTVQLTASADGVKRIVAYRKLAGLPLLVIAGVSTERVFSDWQHRLKDVLIILLVVSFAILLATFLLVRALSNIEQAEEKLLERESHFRAVANSTVDAVISVTHEQRVQFWSRGAERIFEIAGSAAQGELLSKYLHFPGEQGLQQTLVELAQQGAAQPADGTFEVQGIRSNRWTFPTELSVSAGTTGGKLFYTLIVRDVTERKALEERIRRLASHDNLTRLPNRSLLMDRLTVAMAQVRRQGGQFALLFLDLDEFKPVNDSHGHDVGDQLLQQVAERLLETLRESDTVARVGGDEFAMLLTNVVDKNTITSACVNILKALNRTFVLQEIRAQIGGSIGAVLYTGQEITGSDLIRLADMAMYAAKRSGKNRYVFAQSSEDVD